MSEDSSSINIDQVWADYAKMVGHTPLSDAEKQQAMANAVLSGKRVEPFASFGDAGRQLLRSLVGEECWNKRLSREQGAEMPETIMGFPVKYVDASLPGGPLGEIVFGDWSCWVNVQQKEQFARALYIAAESPVSYTAEQLAELIRETWHYLQEQELVGEGKPTMPVRLLGLPVKWKASPSGPWPQGDVVLDESGCWVDKEG